MRKPMFRTTGSLVSVAVLSALSLGFVAPASQATDPAFAALNTEQQAVDRLPEHVSSDQFSQDSSRHLANTEGAQHWVAKNSSGETCLVTALDDPDVSTSTCATAEVFAQQGISHSLFGLNDTVGTEVHVIPDGHADRVKDATGWTQVTSNLFTSDPFAPTSEGNVKIDDSFTATDVAIPGDTAGVVAGTSDDDPALLDRSIQYANDKSVRQLVHIWSNYVGSHTLKGAKTVIQSSWITACARTILSSGTIKGTSCNVGGGEVSHTSSFLGRAEAWWNANGPDDITHRIDAWYYSPL